jgi:hypothetical protein
MTMEPTLPPEPALPPFAATCARGVYCKVCLVREVSAVHRAAWSLRYSGVPGADEPCPLGKAWGEVVDLTVSAARPVPTAEEVDRRAGEPCQFRAEDGTCMVCECAVKDKPCRVIVARGDCPAWWAEGLGK